jgi:hypothetical protein
MHIFIIVTSSVRLQMLLEHVYLRQGLLLLRAAFQQDTLQLLLTPSSE